MKTKILLSILALSLYAGAFCQNTIVMTYTATYYGQYVPLDSIFIENLTQGGDTMLYAQDTVLILSISGNKTGYGSGSLVYHGSAENLVGYKSIMGINDFGFAVGDTLRFTGFAKNPSDIIGSDVIGALPTGNETYAFGIIEGIPCPGTPMVTWAGQTYKTVQIGDQCWFKENLNVGTMIPVGQQMTNNGIIEKYCHNDLPDKCIEFGAFYQWDELMQYSTDQGTQGICPPGWHVPVNNANEDWCKLTQFIDPTVECNGWDWTGTNAGTKMKSAAGWISNGSGTNDFGFTALAGGNVTNWLGQRAVFWSSNQVGIDGANGITLYYDDPRIYRLPYYKTNGRGVRCVKGTYNQGNGMYFDHTIDVNGTSRSYRLYQPEDYNGMDTLPMVLAFHGFSGSISAVINTAKLYMIADTARFFVVYPQGLVVEDLIFGGLLPGWNVPVSYSADQDDILFVNTILDDVLSNPALNIDTNRIHALGGSNGGEMALYLACALSDRIASVADVVGQMSLPMMDTVCSPGRPVSVLHLLGTADPYFPVNGNDFYPPLEGAAEYWAAQDGCDSIPEITYLPDIDPNDGSTVTLKTYGNCNPGFEVLCYRIEGGGHNWPGSGETNSNNDINASIEIWEFFRRNPYPGSISSCLPDGITFSTQEQIDSFQVNYGGCSMILGDVVIEGTDISNLMGMNEVTFIEGCLTIINNDALLNLAGLDNLVSIEGKIDIQFNDNLISLSGIDNIDSASINELFILNNNNLSTCHVQSICDYLESPIANIYIGFNAQGCYNQAQVEDSCNAIITSFKEFRPVNTFTISPNPFESNTLIEYTLKYNSPVTLKILDLSGREIAMLVNEVRQQGEQKVVFDSTGLPAGIYFCVLKTNEGIQTKKIIKLN